MATFIIIYKPTGQLWLDAAHAARKRAKATAFALALVMAGCASPTTPLRDPCLDTHDPAMCEATREPVVMCQPAAY